jgi:DNA gyrase subunit A
MNLQEDDACVGLMVVSPESTVLTVSELGLGKRGRFDDYRLTRRGAKGVVNMKVGKKTGAVVACMAVQEEDEVMLMTHQGMVVRTPVNGIRVIGRATQGVRVIRLNEEDRVVAVARLAATKEEPAADDAAAVVDGTGAVDPAGDREDEAEAES